MKAYSLDFRQRIVDTYFKELTSQRKVAQRFGVALSFVEKLLKQLRETGDLAPTEMYRTQSRIATATQLKHPELSLFKVIKVQSNIRGVEGIEEPQFFVAVQCKKESKPQIFRERYADVQHEQFHLV